MVKLVSSRKEPTERDFTEASPEAVIAMLEECIRDIRSGDRPSNKAFVILLDEHFAPDPEKLVFAYNSQGMSTTQCIAYCEIAKKTLIEDEMGL